jgi:hypothetical protein
MPTHITLTRSRGKALTQHANPDPLTPVADEVAQVGLQGGRRVRGPRAVRLRHDGRRADNETVAHLSVDLSPHRTARIQTQPAISLDEPTRIASPNHERETTHGRAISVQSSAPSPLHGRRRPC